MAAVEAAASAEVEGNCQRLGGGRGLRDGEATLDTGTSGGLGRAREIKMHRSVIEIGNAVGGDDGACTCLGGLTDERAGHRRLAGDILERGGERQPELQH